MKLKISGHMHFYTKKGHFPLNVITEIEVNESSNAETLREKAFEFFKDKGFDRKYNSLFCKDGSEFAILTVEEENPK